MDRKKAEVLLMVSGAVLGIAGLVFIVLSMTKDEGSSRFLIAGLLCAALGSLCNVIRTMRAKKNAGK